MSNKFFKYKDQIFNAATLKVFVRLDLKETAKMIFEYDWICFHCGDLLQCWIVQFLDDEFHSYNIFDLEKKYIEANEIESSWDDAKPIVAPT